MITDTLATPSLYFHRELPPREAEVRGVHSVDATSARVRGSLSRGGELWARCHDDLMTTIRGRLEQEIRRLGGDYAHVYGESIDSRRDDATGEVWLHGRFDYVLYAQPAGEPATSP